MHRPLPPTLTMTRLPTTRGERESIREADKRAKSAEKKRAAAQAALEADIEATEARIAEVEASLADPNVYGNGARAREMVSTQRELRSRLEGLWADLGKTAEKK